MLAKVIRHLMAMPVNPAINKPVEVSDRVTVWANSFIGEVMRHDGKLSRVLSWKIGDRGRGIWFNLESGYKAYRSIPKEWKR